VVNARVASVHDVGRGPIIVKFKQDIGGIEVFRDEISVIMNRDRQLIALSGYLTGTDGVASVTSFGLQPADAISKALVDVTGVSINSGVLQKTAAPANTPGTTDLYEYFTADRNDTQGYVLGDVVRSKQVMYHLVDEYVPAYYIETNVLIPVIDPGQVDLAGEPVTTLGDPGVFVCNFGN
jgi:hypothetical protein